MKKRFPCFLAILAFVLALAGCGDSSKPVKPEDMDKGYIHFAVNLILEDIIRRGETSPYAQLSPAPVLNPYLMPGTDNVIKDFRRNFTTAEDKYYQLRGTGTMVRGTVNSVDRPNRELVFVQEDKTSKPPFTGTLRLSLDKTRYSETAMPAYAPGDTAVFMCKEYRPIHDFKNETTHQIEIRLIQCTTADDYYAVFQAHIEERLMDIYSGKEPVNPDMAQHLAMFYLAAQSLPKQSVCLSGSFLACHENMMDEIARKYQDVKAVNIGSMKIEPNRLTVRKPLQIHSEPAKRPDNADISPSGQHIHEQSAQVKQQKEVVSGIKVPPR